MWMKRSIAMGPGQGRGQGQGHGPATQRNFLRENRLLVSQTPLALLRRLERQREREQDQDQDQERDPCRYELPTTASLARRAGTLPLLHSRRHEQGQRQRRPTQRSEKQIQTEDICDEQFLNAALLKCTEQARFLRACSEGDDPFDPLDCEDAASSCVRRTASNFELGKVASWQRGKRPLAGIESKQVREQEEPEVVAAPLVQQLSIPDITDVEQEPQLDQSLSARTNASSCSQATSAAPTPASTAAADEAMPDALQREWQLEQQRDKQRLLLQDHVLLTEQQRILWLKAAQLRQRELIWEYNRLPLSSCTLRVRNLKLQLEQQLDRIDSDLRMLNLPQVYIGRDQLQQIPSISC